MATLIVSVVGAPRLAADANREPDSSRGWAAGALVTLAAFVLGAFLFAWLPLFTTEALSTAPAIEIVGGVLQLFCIGLLVGLIFLVPALPIGMAVGWLLYEFHRRARWRSASDSRSVTSRLQL